MEKRATLGVIGAGFMANAIIGGAIAKKFLFPEEILVSEPDETLRSALAARGVRIASDNRTAAASCDYLLLSVKPQVFPAVARELEGTELPVLISIMAGKTRAAIARATGAKKVARVMPNLPCSVGAGMSGTDCSALSPREAAFVQGLFGAVGEVAEVGESLLDAVTAVSGSGPAYVYLFLLSLVHAGIKEGMTEDQAKKFAFQTVEGGMKMAKTSDKSLEELIAAVSSKGGTTVAALDSFKRDGFEESVLRAVNAAVRRAKELSE